MAASAIVPGPALVIRMSKEKIEEVYKLLRKH